MNYKKVIEYLYNATPMFQKIGAAAYKPGLETIKELAALYGNPHFSYPVIHIAGTNGKGSCSHTLAAVLQSTGLKVGLFTSPHLVDFRERIRINGRMISKRDVCEWVNEYIRSNNSLQPSFFELTTLMAFDYFARKKVDVAIIETGLGGRLDSTNIVNPVLSIITNISKDHTAQLGNTLESIASEKAGIIKKEVPVIFGEGENEQVREVIIGKATEMNSSLVVASDSPLYDGYKASDKETADMMLYKTPFGDLLYGLTGEYQLKNANTVLHALCKLKDLNWNITDRAVRRGFQYVKQLTGLRGRWDVISKEPLIICDTGHNEGGWTYLSDRLATYGNKLHVIVGFVNDKDVESILKLLPKEATYYFTRASVPRALDAIVLKSMGNKLNLHGEAYDTVETALNMAIKEHGSDDVIFVGGSNFIVADLLAFSGNYNKIP